MRNTFPSTDVVAVITPAQFADYIGGDVTDPLLPGIAIAATAAIIEFIQCELITRERTTVWENWPTSGTNTAPSLSPNDLALDRVIPLPYAKLSTPATIAVEASGEATTEYRILEQRPAALYFSTLPYVDTGDAPALRAVYDAGYGTIDDVPEVYKQAALMVGAYLYEHRGDCTAEDALKKSGADVLLTPYKAQVVVL